MCSLKFNLDIKNDSLLFVLLIKFKGQQINNSQQKQNSQDSRLMAQTTCRKHNLQIENICASEDCHSPFCSECIADHSKNTGHMISVKLNEKSKQFFITWNDYLVPRVSEMIGRLKIKGYAAVFQLVMRPNYPNNCVSEIVAAEISQSALEVLTEHRSIVTQNAEFVSSTKKIDDLRVPDFYKDICNLFTKDLSSNMKKITQIIEKKLVEKFPTKQIYKFVEFKFNQRDLKLMEDTKAKLIKVIQKKVITNLLDDGQGTLNKSGGQSEISQHLLIPNSPRKYLTLKKLEIETETEKLNPQSPSPYSTKQAVVSTKNQQASPKVNGFNANSQKISYAKESPKNGITTEKSGQKTKLDPFDPLKKSYQRKPTGTKQNQLKQEIRSPYNKANSVRVNVNSPNNEEYRSKFLSPTTRAQQSNKQDDSLGNKVSDQSFTAEKQIRTLKGEVNKLKIQLQDKDRTIKRLQIANDQVKKESFELQKEISSLQKSIVEINFSQDETKNKTSRELQDAKFGIERQKREFEGKIRTLENNLHVKESQLQRVKRDYQISRDTLNHKSQFIKDLLSHFPVKITIRDNEEIVLKKQIQQIIEKQKSLQDRISKHSEVFTDFSSIKRVESTQDLQNKKTTSKNSSNAQNPQGEIDTLKAANQKLKSNEKKLLLELQKIQLHIDGKNNTQAILEERDQLLKRVQQKDQIFQLYKFQKEDHIRKLQAQIQQYIKSQDQKFVERKNSQNSLQVKAQHIENLKLTIGELQSKLKECREAQVNDNQNLSENLEEKQKQVCLLKKQISDYELKVKQLEAQVEEGSNIDEELLGDIVQLDAQIAARDKDIQILTGTIMECAKKYRIEAEYLKSKFQHLTTVRINVK